MPLLRQRYSIPLRDVNDYKQLVKYELSSGLYDIKTQLFSNETRVSLDGNILWIDIKLKISLVTVGVFILIGGVLFAVFDSYGIVGIPIALLIFITFLGTEINYAYKTINHFIINSLYFSFKS